jgi:hypothetical protein
MKSSTIIHWIQSFLVLNGISLAATLSLPEMSVAQVVSRPSSKPPAKASINPPPKTSTKTTIGIQTKPITQAQVITKPIADLAAKKEPPRPQTTPPKSTILSVAIVVNQRQVIESIQVKGQDDGERAIGFDRWLIPFEKVTEVLKIIVKPTDKGQLELRGAGIVTRINPEELVSDPDLGSAISVADIQRLLGVTVTFDASNYAVVFQTDWSNATRQRQRNNPILKSDYLSGLPQANPPGVSLSEISQSLSVSGTGPHNSIRNTTTSGSLAAVGTLGGGSWYTRINQPTVSNLRTWNIAEAQYFRPTESSDYILGSQPTFWQNQTGQQYWGFTTVQRSGFIPPHSSSNGFIPQQRLSSAAINRTITGEAAPGTLVQLVQGYSDEIVGEILVDSSGIYRFDILPFAISGSTLSGNYRVRLFANGRLSSTPEIREDNFSNLPGQLSVGTSAWILSAGLNRYQRNDAIVGDLKDFTGGAAYRFGATESLTLGAGVVYDRGTLGYGELIFQPTNPPLQISMVGLFGGSKGLQYNANLLYRPSQNLQLRIDADDLVRRFQIDWRNAAPGIGLRVGGNSRENTLFAGINTSQRIGNLSTYADFSIDTKNNARWYLNSYLDHWQLFHQGNELSTNSELIYNFSRNSSQGNSLHLAYETRTTGDALSSLTWRYRSADRTWDGRNLWETELGYGTGSRGNGVIVTAATNTIPGLVLRLRYDSISVLSDASSFRLEVTSSISFAPRIGPGDQNLDRLRNEGVILLQPFLDDNNNGRLDSGEQIYQEDHNLLFSIDNQPMNAFYPLTNNDGSTLRLKPGQYRVDLDPSGYPVGWSPRENSYAVTVSPGGYTVVMMPMQKSFTIIGVVQDSSGAAIDGAKVEAKATEGTRKYLSVTNGSGIYTLDALPSGTYNLTINGQPAEPGLITIGKQTETTQELNLKRSNLPNQTTKEMKKQIK